MKEMVTQELKWQNCTITQMNKQHKTSDKETCAFLKTLITLR
jgi:hypothetical protein